MRKPSQETVLVLIAVVALVGIFPSAFGVGLTFSSEITLSDSPGKSNVPQIAVNGSKIYVAWKDVDSTNSDTEILFKRSTDRGNTFTTNAINITSSLTTNSDPDDLYPPLLAFSETSGNVYLVWVEANVANREIYFAGSTDSGATFGTPVNLSSQAGGKKNPAIAVNGTNVYVAWADSSQDSSYDIYFRSSSDGGANWSPSIGSAPTRIFTSTGEPSQAPYLAAWGNNVYIIWEDESGTDDKIYFRSSSDKGANWSPDTSSTPHDFGGTAANTKRIPRLAVDNDKIYSVWRESTSTKIFFRNATDSSGTLTFSPALASAPTTLRTYSGTPQDIQIGADGNSVIVAWDEAATDTDVFFTNSTNRGVTFSNAKDLSGNAINANNFDIAINGTSSFVVWSNENSSTDWDVVSLSSFSSSSTKFSSTASDVTAHSSKASNPDVATDGTKMFVVWEDDRTSAGNPEIMFRTGTASGQDVDFDKSTYRLGDTVTLTVTAPSTNTNPATVNTLSSTITSTSDSSGISVTLTETGKDTNTFTGTFTFSTSSSNDSSDILKVAPGDTVSATYSSTTTNVSIYSRTVDIPQSSYSIGDTTYVVVTDQNSNINSASAETITVTVSSTKSGKSTTLNLTETGVNTGIFGSSSVKLRFSNNIAEIPIDSNITITQEHTASQGTTDVTVASESESGVTITLEETSTLGKYQDIIKLSTSASSGNSVKTSAGEFVSVTKGSIVTYAIITPRTDLSKAVLQVSVTGNLNAGVADTVTATFGGKTDTATVNFGSGESGGGGGGLVRPTIVLNAVLGLGGADRSPPMTTLSDIIKSKQFDVPDHIKEIIKNQNLDVLIKPVIDEPYDLPLAINEKQYPLGDIENRIETDKLEVGKPVKFKMLFYEQGDLEHVSMYMNLRDNLRSDQSDTFIVYEKRQSMEIVDKNGFFENVNFEIVEGEDDKKFAIFEITFAKPMETSDLVYKTWDFDRRGTAIKIHDAIKVEGLQTEETMAETTDENTVQSTEEKPHTPEWVKSNAKWWSEGQIDDKTFTNGISYLISEKIIDVPVGPNVSESKDEDSEIQEEQVTEEIKVPEWIKTNAKWWAEDLIDEDTFLSGIEYLVKRQIITVT